MLFFARLWFPRSASSQGATMQRQPLALLMALSIAWVISGCGAGPEVSQPSPISSAPTAAPPLVRPTSLSKLQRPDGDCELCRVFSGISYDQARGCRFVRTSLGGCSDNEETIPASTFALCLVRLDGAEVWLEASDPKLSGWRVCDAPLAQRALSAPICPDDRNWSEYLH